MIEKERPFSLVVGKRRADDCPPGQGGGALGSEAAGSNRLTQADRSALSERRMLEAAVELMGERGYEKTTLAAIGEAAGLQPRARHASLRLQGRPVRAGDPLDLGQSSTTARARAAGTGRRRRALRLRGRAQAVRRREPGDDARALRALVPVPHLRLADARRSHRGPARPPGSDPPDHRAGHRRGDGARRCRCRRGGDPVLRRALRPRPPVAARTEYQRELDAVAHRTPLRWREHGNEAVLDRLHAQ